MDDGTNDNMSGFTAVMEIGRSLGKLLQRGWRPDRTIVLAGWDGEEYGLLGSTEYGEQFEKDLTKNAVAYLNMDGVAGRSFSAGAVPSLDKLHHGRLHRPGGAGRSTTTWKGDAQRRRSTASAAAPTRRCSSTIWACRGWRSASRRVGGEYHSAYDDTEQMERFLDPGYLGHQAASRMSGVLALRLANADALPLRYSDYARQVDAYVTELQQIQQRNPNAAQVDLTPLHEAAALGHRVDG